MTVRPVLTAALALGLCGLAAAAPVTADKKPATNEDVQKAEGSFTAGRFDEAFGHLQAAVKKNPNLPPARLMLARMFLAAREGSAARQVLEIAITENPDHPEVFLQNGSVALGEGRLTETVLNCQQALDLCGSARWTVDQRRSFQSQARRGLAAAFEARRDWPSARAQLTALLDIEPKDGRARQQLARTLFLLGKPDDAFAELQTSVKDDSALDPPEVTMGLLYTAANDAKKADEWLQKAIGKYPKDARAHRAYGGWLLDQGRLDAAKLHIEQAAAIEPKAPETPRLRGLLARHEKKMADAEKVFDDLHREAPADFWASNQLALVLVESSDPKQRERAVQLAEVNARQYGKSAEAVATLGWCYLKAGRPDEAEKVLSQLLAAGQLSPDAAYYIARLLEERKKPEDAIKFLQGAVKSSGAFVNRKDADKKLAELQAAYPEKKDAPKK